MYDEVICVRSDDYCLRQIQGEANIFLRRLNQKDLFELGSKPYSSLRFTFLLML